MDKLKFPCTMCGACCRNIGNVLASIEENVGINNPQHPLYFPYLWDETGKCENLLSDNTCKVYETRPLVCNIEKGAELLKIDKKEFFNDNIRYCNKLIENERLPDKFKIELIL